MHLYIKMYIYKFLMYNMSMYYISYIIPLNVNLKLYNNYLNILFIDQL